MWGKFGQQDNKTQVKEFTETSEFWHFLDSAKHDMRWVSPLDEESVEVHHKMTPFCETSSPNLNIFIAAYTTWHARLPLYQALDLQERCLYSDTDSVVFVKNTNDPPMDFSGDYLTALMKQLQAGTNKDVTIAHLNVCSLRSKIEELRCLQQCRFEILAVTETHLHKSVPDSEVNTLGMKFIRLDRKGRKGGGCILYYAEHLRAFHRKDLFTSGIEAAWLQINFPSAPVLFSVMYRHQTRANFSILLAPLWRRLG